MEHAWLGRRYVPHYPHQDIFHRPPNSSDSSPPLWGDAQVSALTFLRSSLTLLGYFYCFWSTPIVIGTLSISERHELWLLLTTRDKGNAESFLNFTKDRENQWICNSVYEKENGKSVRIQFKICTKVFEMCCLYMFFFYYLLFSGNVSNKMSCDVKFFERFWIFNNNNIYIYIYIFSTF